MSTIFRKCRLTTGLNQEEAAKKLGIHPTTLNKYEGGSRYPSGKLLSAMSRLYKVNLDTLLLEAGNISETTSEGEESMKQKLNKMEGELLELYRENRMLKEALSLYEKKERTRDKAVNGD